ncbi:ATP-binding cassette domain-containing protein [Austwickia chelonae]|uniref:Putative ABC transporter ATP-binding protein n=1 Tax=Austwickia chelonae NBRC 105200 TaxID=1184607 RepID=K6W5B2_9MICO|nr:putative ABC transporter ATP-binding protein [Austwickia chelonae NBRC 105200]
MSITVKNLEYSFPRTRKARKLSSGALVVHELAISQGSWIHLTGDNGSGKSTLIKLILGILRPDSGSILVLGQDAYRKRRKLMRDTGVVWGHRSTLWWDASTEDALRALNAMYRSSDAHALHLQQELVQRLGTQDFMSRPIRTLSLGQRQRVEILAALSHAPSRIFLDEPFVGLDKSGVESVKATLEELFADATVIIVDHEASVPTRCNRVDMSDLAIRSTGEGRLA